MEKERIQKIIAKMLPCSRRKAEDLIKEKKVFCNGSIVELGDKATEKDKIFVENLLLKSSKKKNIYLMLNKPPGYVTTLSDEKNRKTVIDLIYPKIKERIYPIGRLDLNSQGLLLLTNDGEFCNMILHPRNKIKKIYHVTTKKNISKEEIKNLEEGVIIDNFKTKPCKVEIIFNSAKKSKFKITLHEGKKRQIRKMVENVMNIKVEKLKRIQIGSIKLNGLPIGKFRFLNKKEVESLRNIDKLAK